MRSLLRAVVLLSCVALLTAGVFVSSRYLSNRRLMASFQPFGSRGDGIVFGWNGPATDWLERWIGTDAAVAVLCRPESIRVYAPDNVVADATVQLALQSCSGLDQIFIHNRNLPNGCLEAIATRHCVETFHFRLPTILPADAQWLSKMSQLKHVNVGQFVREARHNDWSWLKALPDLEYLEVTLWGACDEDVVALAECPAAKNLSLSGESLSDDAVKRLCDLSALQFLDLYGPQIHLHFANGRKLPPSLEALDLRSEGIDDASLVAIAGLPRIKRISISNCRVTDSGLETLARLPALNQLWLDNLLEVTDNGLKSLTANTSLTEIHVVRCGTTPLGLIQLNDIPNWRELRFDNIEIRREPGAAPPILTPENVVDYLSMQREMQHMQQRVYNGPVL